MTVFGRFPREVALLPVALRVKSLFREVEEETRAVGRGKQRKGVFSFPEMDGLIFQCEFVMKQKHGLFVSEVDLMISLWQSMVVTVR